jgi:putative hydrolase of the HAD superfamily
MNRIEAISFDLDETLLDGSAFAQSIEQTCRRIKEYRPLLEPERILKANRAAFSELGPATIDDWTLGRLSGLEVSRRIWNLTLALCGETDVSLVDWATAVHLKLAESTYRPFEDATRLLSVLGESRIPMALITNGASDTQRAKLQMMGLLDRFDPLVISGEIGAAKPDEAAFSPLRVAFDCPAKEIWHVGDSLTTDVAGAAAVGFTAVWLNRSGAPARGGMRPDLEITSLTELINSVNCRCMA